MSQIWKLVGPDGKPYTSAVPGTLGGHRRNRIYGRLDCPAALRAIARGGYITHRVFFATSEDARAVGYRPCAVCLPGAYTIWKTQQDGVSETRSAHDPGRQ
jgi:methylphosphotriester-DNA--protein-cysteine methyltransferase